MNVARPKSPPTARGNAVDPGDGGHVVHFYSSDDELVADVVAHLAAALGEGGTALAIATQAHRAAFAQGLADLGIEPNVLKRVSLLDADETLQRFLVDGQVDADRFNETVGELVGSCQPPVHAFGEMVAVLWEAGRIEQAIDLEILWNALGERYPFVLLCGYPDESCLWDEQANDLARVCQIHSAVIGSAAPREARATEGDQRAHVGRLLRLSRQGSSVRTARALVREVFTDYSASECEVAELVVSELVTNALEHGSGEIVLEIVARNDSVLISVSDDDPKEPTRKEVNRHSPRGRGLQIVEALSNGWGVTPIPTGGKAVWAMLECKVSAHS